MIVVLDAEPFLQVALVDVLEEVLGVELAVFAADDLDARHNVFENLPVDLLGEADVLVGFPVDVKPVW